MPNDSTEIRSYGDGGLHLAPPGTPLPETYDEELDAAFTHLGYTTTDGVKPTFGREVKDVEAWQSLDPVKQLFVKAPKSIKTALLQTNTAVLLAALGGGSVVSDGGDGWVYEPADAGDIDTYVAVLEGVEDDIVFRLCYKAVQQQGEVEFAFIRDDATSYAIDLKVLADPDGGKPFKLLTNAPGLDESTGS